MKILSAFCLLFMPCRALALADDVEHLDLTSHWVGYCALLLFCIAYGLVIFEERLRMRKSKPVLFAAGLIWVLIAIYYSGRGDSFSVAEAMRISFLEYTELFFFLLVAMTYINAMLERGVFNALRDWLIVRRFGYRSLFWLTGIIAFFLSGIADNLTTALILSAVVLAVGQGQPGFVALGCTNIVVSANAGGAFSPFGDITTLMVWQNGVLEFGTFFKLFIPSLVNFLVPAFLMQFALPSGQPELSDIEREKIKQGGLVMAALFLLTIVTAISFHNFLHLPPVFGMMLGLAYLKFFGYYLRHQHRARVDYSDDPTSNLISDEFDVFDKIAKAEWDTLFFFYGVIMLVGGLGFIGYLSVVSGSMYGQLGATNANILVGMLSAIVDNIPVMYAVLTMQPAMDQTQWLLVTLTAGVGGSLLSVGSAAGVALMGQARGQYTFFSHLKWTPVIALGYGLSIWVHFLVNG